jgi:RNA polymerase sigma factor (sigma-70 family)
MILESLVKKAQSGDKEALEELVLAIQDKIYYLAIRMLFLPEDASEATQEILIIIITKLSTFEFKSKFSTWVYRVSTNYLLNNKKVIAKDQCLKFEDFKADLEIDLQDPGNLQKSPDYPVLLNEIRIMCTMAMLLCLDQKHRMAYILGDIFELDQSEASECLSLSKDNYRKQLSRARKKVIDFTSSSCGLVNNNAKCSCETKLQGAINRGRVIPNQISLFNKSSESYIEVKQKINEMAGDLKTAALQTSIPILKNPENFIEIVESLMSNLNYRT